MEWEDGMRVMETIKEENHGVAVVCGGDPRVSPLQGHRSWAQSPTGKEMTVGIRGAVIR